MRGETDRLVDTGLIEGAVVDLVVRAANAATVVDAQRLVAELRGFSGVRTAEIVTALTPVAGDLDLLARLPVGPAQWGQELRVEFSATPARVELMPAAAEIAAAADRALAQPCRAVAPPPMLGSPLAWAITTGARAMIVAVDPARGWSALSDSFTTVLGYDRHRPPDCRLVDLIHPDDRPAAAAMFLACCTGRHPDRAVDLRLCTIGGHWRTIEVAARSFVDDAQVGAVVFFGLDVTHQRETERTARREQQRLARLVETTGDGLLLLDAAGRVGLANRAAHRLLDTGVTDDDDPIDWAAMIARAIERLGPDAGRVERLRAGFRARSAVVGEELAFEDGRVLELDLVPVSSPGDVDGGTLVHLRDVTARVAVRRGLEERSRGLEERNRALIEATALNNEFIASVSHELRGPLSSVVAFSHLLGDVTTGVLSEDQRTYLDVIDRNANRLLRLIEDLLLLSRLESRTLQLKPVPTRLPELLSAAVAERVPAALAAGIDLTLVCADGPELVCDDTRVHQVVDNLVSNAVKFTPSGGRVTVRAGPAEPPGEGWRVAVADSGVGIPAADLPRLFSAFFRGSNVTAVVGRQVMPGTGLGLVVSRAIVELHGGSISVASTEGVGTTVTLSLPTRPARNGG
ncbi:PAS domain-containing sensor histidine kinase [Dactylosporangium sp. AC04546]|uniref:sensor histidine kinase n=1 Tax=Dactylosporangium sp. AC04546 TaxID=2862460 RepID=UPI001EDE745E|nr:PAS domain-containing sensor histidine kinase [Dactylosporangium sp. AC04546]WVK82608.1 PAS domain-containing sensor histidine kinase [Dactylosporangium sp. AC04546]